MVSAASESQTSQTAVVDDHRPLLAPDINYVNNDDDSNVLKKWSPSYASVQTIAREESKT